MCYAVKIWWIWIWISVLFWFPNVSPNEDDGLLSKSCAGPNRFCTVWQSDTQENDTIHADDEQFLLYNSKVAYINGSYVLINSSLPLLPTTHSLIGINGPVIITGNEFLEYTDELIALEHVEGPVIIRSNNKLLSIPISLFDVMCKHKDSICDLDVFCTGDVYIIDGYSPTFHPRCNVIYGDLVVSGQKDDKNEAASLLSNVHTVYGSVRLNFNEVKNFTFLRSLSRIEYSGDGGCALEIVENQGLNHFGLKLKTIQLKHKAANKFCVLKNRREGSNEYYNLNSNEEDKKVFLALRSNSSVKTDNSTGTLEYKPAATYFNLTNCILAGTTVFFLGATIFVVTFWTSDYACRACFYKCVPRRQRFKKKTRRGRKSKDSGEKSCYVGLANGQPVDGGVKGYVNEYDYSNGAVYVTGATNSDEAPGNRSCYLAGQAAKKSEGTPEPAKTCSK